MLLALTVRGIFVAFGTVQPAAISPSNMIAPTRIITVALFVSFRFFNRVVFQHFIAGLCQKNFPHTIVTTMFYRGRSVVMAQSTAGGKGEADKLAALAVGIELARHAFAPNGGCVWVGDD